MRSLVRSCWHWSSATEERRLARYPAPAGHTSAGPGSRRIDDHLTPARATGARAATSCPLVDHSAARSRFLRIRRSGRGASSRPISVCAATGALAAVAGSVYTPPGRVARRVEQQVRHRVGGVRLDRARRRVIGQQQDPVRLRAARRARRRSGRSRRRPIARARRPSRRRDPGARPRRSPRCATRTGRDRRANRGTRAPARA